MNPDYKKEETAAPATAAAAEEPAAPPTGGQATTEYYGGTESPTNPAWAAEAKMNPDYDKSTPSAASSSTDVHLAYYSAPVRDAAVEACRDALSTEAQAAKLYFANSSFDIEPGSQATLRKIAAIVKNCGNVVVEVGGHTDNTGAPDIQQDSFSASGQGGGRFPHPGRRRSREIESRWLRPGPADHDEWHRRGSPPEPSHRVPSLQPIELGAKGSGSHWQFAALDNRPRHHL